MFSPITIITIILFYVGCLFLVAQWTEWKLRQGVNLTARPYIYALSLAVYHTSWTYYGSVGLAATTGLHFLPIYIGPTLFMLFWWTVLRKLVRIKSAYHIASIADFISARYDKSKALAFLATLTALVGVTPYIALQLKSVLATFSILTPVDSHSWLVTHFDAIVISLGILFTILFGVRRLDPTERHEGMVMALAVECLVKLVAFLAAGIFVTYFLYDGFGDIFTRLAASPYRHLLRINGESSSYVSWFSLTLLSASAILFLPRQFHIAVVENADEDHIRTALWFFPLYMLLINIFILPIAAGGLLAGIPAQAADTFVLTLPMVSGKPWLAALVFVGGFSAAIGMIMLSAVTLSTMASNYLLLPLLDISPRFSFLRRHLLQCRWVIVMLVLLLGYVFERLVGESYMLVSMGVISFAAVLQFAPVILGGIFWRGGNRAGALLGLGGGFAVWLYTSLLPAFVRSGWLPQGLLDRGPWGLFLLRPEQLFGLGGLDTVSHTIFWSLLFNAGLYTFGSLCFRQSPTEQALAGEYVGILQSAAALPRKSAHEGYIDLGEKCREAQQLLQRFLPPGKAGETVERCREQVGLKDTDRITILELTEFHNEVEKWLAGSVGTAMAHETMRKGATFSEREARELSEVYGEILANLRVTPEELWRKVDFYREREELLASHARELEEKVRELDRQIGERRKAEAEIRTLILELEERVSERTAQLEAANRELDAFAYSVSHDLRAPLRGIEGFSRILQTDFSGHLPTEAHRFLDQVRDNSRKMGQLIDDLLAFSRLGRQPLRKETVHLDRLAREVMQELEAQWPGRKIAFTIGELPPGRADPNLLRVVLSNLLSNAVKFTGRRELARIEVGCRQEEGGAVYFVKDNGAGFDMRYSGKLFGVFQRLHSPQEFDGTGVGLATVQRIIHRHGGRIWAEAEVDRGTTFYFTLGNESAAPGK